MSKRRITKASKARLTLFGTLSIVAIVYFSITLILNCYTIYSLTKQKQELDRLYVKLQENAEDLKLDIEKLNDTKYLEDYIRENYLYSKENEYIIQIEEIVEKQDEIDIMSNKVNRNYVLAILISLVILIFIYIFIKSRKKQKK